MLCRLSTRFFLLSTLIFVVKLGILAQAADDVPTKIMTSDDQAAGNSGANNADAAAKGGPNGLSNAEKEARRAKHQKFVDELEKEKKKQPGFKGRWQSKVHEQFALLDDEQLAKLNGDTGEGPKQAGKKHAGGGERHTEPEEKPLKEHEPELKHVGKVKMMAPATKGRAKRQDPTWTEVWCDEYVFDIRDQWPECADIVNNVRDQSLCGDCWAVSASAAFTDRRCVQKAQKGLPITADDGNFFSAYDTATCSDGAADGVDACNGGSSAKAWRWFSTTGVVSGHNYSQSGCIPYPFPATKDATQSSYKAPVSTSCSTKSCTKAGYAKTYSNDKTKALSWNYLYSTGWEQTMKDEIIINGSISASMLVYADFQTYAGGVYQHVTGVLKGGHAIRLIGYGNITCDDGTAQKYWLGVNSWNKDWGEAGTFKIARGVDECNIETRSIAYGIPNV